MNKMKNLKFNDSIENHLIALKSLESMVSEIEGTAASMVNMINQGGRIFWMGNGGSAADAQHLATELVVKFEKKRKALSAISLSTDTSVLTAIGNDFGFENIFSRQIEEISSKGDLVIPISTSGNSLNIIKAINWCNQKKIRVFPFLGKNGGKVKKLVSDFIVVPSNKTSFIQEYHIFIGQSLCFYLDKKFN